MNPRTDPDGRRRRRSSWARRCCGDSGTATPHRRGGGRSVHREVRGGDGTLALGRAAIVPFVDYGTPNQSKKTKVGVRVHEVRKGRIADFKGFDLKPAQRRATPYYVDATFENRGGFALSRNLLRASLEDAGGREYRPTTLVVLGGSFRRCPQPGRSSLQPGRSFDGCSVVLLPDKTPGPAAPASRATSPRTRSTGGPALKRVTLRRRARAAELPRLAARAGRARARRSRARRRAATSSRAERLAERAGEQVAERQQRERAHPVVGATRARARAAGSAAPAPSATTRRTARCRRRRARTRDAAAPTRRAEREQRDRRRPGEVDAHAGGIGRCGRQRMPISAPAIVPRPSAAASTP